MELVCKEFMSCIQTGLKGELGLRTDKARSLVLDSFPSCSNTLSKQLYWQKCGDSMGIPEIETTQKHSYSYIEMFLKKYFALWILSFWHSFLSREKQKQNILECISDKTLSFPNPCLPRPSMWIPMHADSTYSFLFLNGLPSLVWKAMGCTFYSHMSSLRKDYLCVPVLST